ncbi:FecR family protein [Sphingobacterium sp. HMA12]|uniref:FecR family protein n=1 Tax=Sphingobacterium sp. HMA12 TaxID=2050894 RepID=UPI000CE9D329|nr:FecR family protein [Sphingobacterium sp. HMA12]
MKESEKLLLKYLEGQASPEEQAIVESWYHNLHTADVSGFDELQKQQQLELIRQQLPGYPIKKIRRWPRIAAAAILLFALGSGIFYYSLSSRDNKLVTVPQHKDIAPGAVGATLTLANGEQILLGDAGEGEIARQAGVSVSKTADGQILYQILGGSANDQSSNTLSTANGQTYVVTLPDQTKIWLNAASSLTYSTALYTSKGQRKVELTGEAYFEVAKDKTHPFVVKTGDLEVEVLGTHFNINSYADEAAISTTLLEGSVRVIHGQRKEIIRPGQQAIATAAGIAVKEVDLDEIVDWKEGDFALNHINFKTAMRKIARWYDVEFIYDSSVPLDMEAGGWISRKNNLSAVLKLIESSGLAHFKIEGRKVYVSK